MENNHKAKQFWSWFTKNLEKLNQIDGLSEESREAFLDDMLDALQKYHPELYFQVEGEPDEAMEFIITAEGEEEFFADAKALVAQAPAIPGWDIIALKQPMMLLSDEAFEVEGLSIRPEQLHFIALKSEENPEMMGIKIFFEDYAQVADKDLLEFGIFQMLEILAGEEAMALHVRLLNINPLPQEDMEEELLPITELYDFIEWYKNDKGEDSE